MQIHLALWSLKLKETENCRIVTRFDGIYEGTFQLNNASVHVNADYSDAKRKRLTWTIQL